MIKISTIEQIMLKEVNRVFQDLGGRFYPLYNDECLYGIDHNPNNDTIILAGYVTTLDGVVVANIRFNELAEHEFIINPQNSECSLNDDNNNDEIKLLANLFNKRQYLIKSLLRMNSRLLM